MISFALAVPAGLMFVASEVDKCALGVADLVDPHLARFTDHAVDSLGL